MRGVFANRHRTADTPNLAAQGQSVSRKTVAEVPLAGLSFPWENGYAESFNGRLRDEFLAMEIFEGVRDARSLTAAWRHEYNPQRPHSSLGYRTPAGFAASCAASASAKASAPAAHAGFLGQPCS